MVSSNISKIDSRHPILRQEYAVYTPPINQMIALIGDWIDQRVSGGYIYGPSRFGKSRAVKWYLKSVLEERFNTVLPLVIWIRRESMMSEREFWNALLNASKYEFIDPMKPKTKSGARFLFEERLFTLARSARNNYVILLIDEAHEVTLKEWKWLLGLQNSLDERGVRLSVFSIGSHNLHYQPDYLANTGNAHIAARFFTFDMKFNGIMSTEELGKVMTAYDQFSEWPKKSGISYLEYFAPNDFKKGQRFENCKDQLWKAFEELLPPNRKESKFTRKNIEIPMQHIAHSIEKALRRLGSGEEWEEVTGYQSWLEIVASTGFTDHLRMISIST